MRHKIKQLFSIYLFKLVASITFVANVTTAIAETVVNEGINLLDDTQTKIHLAKPAERIVSLSPHLTELLFSVGAGNKIVATVDFANYPEQAKKIPNLGNYTKLNAESIIAFKPDLVIAWPSGNDPRVIEQLRQLGVNVYVQEGEDMDLLSHEIRQLGALAGTGSIAEKVASEADARLAALKLQQNTKTPIRVFYQVWNNPLMSVNDKQQIGKMIHLCGGTNIFGNAQILAPQISVESVLAADPDVIIASGMDTSRPEWLDDWKKWPQLKAVKSDDLYFIEPDYVQRFSLRSLDGTEKICGFLDKAREKQNKLRP